MNKTFLILIILLVLFQTSPAFENKSVSAWKRVNPGLGEIQALIPDRRNPGIWYVVNNQNLYRSRDSGRTWQSTGISNVILDEFGKSEAVKVNPSTSEVLVLTNSGHPHPTRLWSSTDFGKTFLLRNASLDASAIFHSPYNPNFLFAFDSSDYGLSVSQDNGRKWNEITRLPYNLQEPFPGYPSPCITEYYDFEDLVFSPFDSKTLYAYARINIICPGESSDENLSLASYNNGQSWARINNNIIEFDVDSAVPNSVIGRSYEGLYQLTSRGWKPLSKKDVRDITRVPENPNHLIGRESSFNPNSSFLRSQDGGRTWSKFSLGLQDIQALELDYNRTWLAGSSAAGMYFRSETQSWNNSNRGFTEARVLDVAHSSDGKIYSLIGEAGEANYLYSSDDNGNSWQRRWFGYSAIRSDDLGHIYLNPKEPQTVAIVVGYVYLSRDSGKHWLRAKIPSRSITSLAFDPLLKDRMYAVGYFAYRSDDGGNTFAKLPLKLESNDHVSVYIDPNDNRVLYFLVPFRGVFRSTDGGQTMEQRNNGIGRHCSDCAFFTPTDLVPLAQSNSFLLSTDRGPIYKTVDGGAHWEKIAVRAGQRIFPVDGTGKSFYVFSGWDLLFTNNEGKTWTNLTATLDPKLRRTAVTDPRLSRWYIGTESGLFVKD